MSFDEDIEFLEKFKTIVINIFDSIMSKYKTIPEFSERVENIQKSLKKTPQFNF